MPNAHAKNGHSRSRLATAVVARRVQTLGCLIDPKGPPNPADNGPIRCDRSTLPSGFVPSRRSYSNGRDGPV
jgi:hypothetical protein